VPTIRQVPAQKGEDILAIRPGTTIHDAVKLTADRDFNSVIVMNAGRLVGIFTERHYARNAVLNGRSSPDVLVGDVMGRRVVCIHLDRSVEECMAQMTVEHVRHPPVIDEGNLVGVVSICDFVKSIISDR
jgi:CBS domain-containing protein